MGGMHGFGKVPTEVDDRVFHAAWEGRVHGLAYSLFGQGVISLDAFRHAIEKIPPRVYLDSPYYGRWARAVEAVLVEAGILREGEVRARMDGKKAPAHDAPAPESSPPGGFVREVDAARQFAEGDSVRVRNLHPKGHTRMPGYVRGKTGLVVRVHAAYVLPDTNAHGLGECPEYLYSVRFLGDELWGDAAESSAPVTVDLFERYLESA